MFNRTKVVKGKKSRQRVFNELLKLQTTIPETFPYISPEVISASNPNAIDTN
jgi:hypothetical protein